MFTPRLHSEMQWFERRAHGVRAWLHPRVGPELSSAWLQAPPALREAANAERASGLSADGRWFVKSRRGFARGLLRALARGLELEEAELPIPVHLAVLVDGTRTHLVTEALAGRDLDVALPTLDADAQGRVQDDLGALVAALHNAGFRQRDLKAPNIRVTDDLALALVDLEGVARSHSTRHFEKDLGRLAASFLALGDAVAEPTRWLASYRAHAPAALAHNALLEARVAQRARIKQDRNARLGRELR